MPDYEFTKRFSLHFQKTLWSDLVKGFNSRPVTICEFGVYEGHSTLWWLDNACAHPDSRVIAVDPGYAKVAYALMEKNFQLHPQKHKIEHHKFESRQFVSTLEDASVDLLYIDGDHEAMSVAEDGLSGFHKLKVGGVMLFDDYDFEPEERWVDRFHLFPKPAIDAVMTLLEGRVEVVHKSYQVALRKLMHRSEKPPAADPA